MNKGVCIVLMWGRHSGVSGGDYGRGWGNSCIRSSRDYRDMDAGEGFACSAQKADGKPAIRFACESAFLKDNRGT